MYVYIVFWHVVAVRYIRQSIDTPTRNECNGHSVDVVVVVDVESTRISSKRFISALCGTRLTFAVGCSFVFRENQSQDQIHFHKKSAQKHDACAKREIE